MFRIVSREHAGFRAVHAEEHVGQLSLQSVGRVQRLPEESMNVFFPTGDREYHMRAWPGGVITRTPLLHEERSSMSELLVKNVNRATKGSIEGNFGLLT